MLLLVVAVSGSRCQCDDPLQAVPDIGDLDGYVCHQSRDALAAGVTVTGEGRGGPVVAVTDVAGYFMLVGLVAGEQTLAVRGEDVLPTLTVTVQASKLTRAPDPPCLQVGSGIVTGRICATEDGVGSGEGYWLADARVYVTVGAAVYETTTDDNGLFTLNGVPAGARTLYVEKGAFAAAADIVVVNGEVTRLDHTCVAPTTAIAVVTGVFDAVETVLQSMGFKVKDCLPAGLAECPTALSTRGTVTLVDGRTPYYITDFLDNDGLLSAHDIVFFNCGLADEYFYSAPDTAKHNLTDFVAQGGSIYVSDRAYELLRVSFADELKFVGTPGSFGPVRQRAWVGVDAAAVAATITDVSLARVVGAPSMSLVYSKSGWVPLDTLGAQPAGVYTWMKAATVAVDLNRDGTADAELADDPLLVTIHHGQGRISYTTFHVSDQATAQMRTVLRYMVFEL
ncbi:MAG: carboxypeptidase regulatory-like domain-containing protein [Deltaproteobacteria bacterium]|nr:carboxypeptidase regulatory-like domain-containing protein [Deltaproteobacteria bacterium]